MAIMIFSNMNAVCLIDDEDADRISKYSWRIGTDGYVSGRRTIAPGVQKRICLHRFLMNAPDGLEVDHKNFDKLDNRKENLRICTSQENVRHRRKWQGTTSQFKGVYFHKRSQKWMAKAKVDSRSVYLGIFDNEIEAASAYNQFVAGIHGEFAVLNQL